MRRKQQRVEQIILVTDGEENACPILWKKLQAYQKELDMYPTLVMVKVGWIGNSWRAAVSVQGSRWMLLSIQRRLLLAAQPICNLMSLRGWIS